LPTYAHGETGTGNLIGYVYDQDGTTPVEGAVITIRNIATGETYASEKTNSKGIFDIPDVAKGIYQYGVRTSQGDFNSDNLIGINEGNTANVSIVLDPYEEREAAAVHDIYQQARIDGEAHVGRVDGFNPSSQLADIFITSGFLQRGDRIHVKGPGTDFYQDVKDLMMDGLSVEKAFAGSTVASPLSQGADPGDLVYLVCKKQGAMPMFLTHPCGIAALVAGAGFVTLGIIELTEEVCVSPYNPTKKK